MALTLYVGGAGCGKTVRLMDDLIRAADREPSKRFYLVVPEQSTMQTQRDLVQRHPRRGIMNLEVTSLNRLAYRVFEECGFRSASLIEEMGKSFLLEKIALEEKNHLRCFGGSLAKPENIAAMKSVISELKTYGIRPEELQAAAGPLEGAGRTAFKLEDIALVAKRFDERLEKLGYMTMEEVPEALSRLAGRSHRLRGSVIALDGFTGFTPVQLPLIESLMKTADELMVTVTIDSARRHTAAKDYDLFKMSWDMLRDLNRIAEDTNTERRPDVICDEEGRHAAPELTFLSARFGRPGQHAYKGPENGAPALRLIEAASPREEAEEAARTISRLVRERGYRYREIGVVTGDLTGSAVHLREAFSIMKIPFFIDEKRSVLQNPFVEYVRAALEACTENYSYDGMFRFLKCRMSPFDPDTVDLLDLYAGGTGLRGKKRWREPLIHTYRGEDPAEVPYLEALRKKICALLDPLSDALALRGGTVRSKCEALYEFFLRSGSEKRLSEMAAFFKENGRPDLAREYAQVYPYVCSLLDKMVSVLGEERISMTDFRALLEAGFAEGRVGIIPPGSDRVVVGDVERSRLGSVKALLFLGVNEGLIPKPLTGGGLLTDRDRGKLREQKIRLKPTAREAVYIQRFYMYLALSKPSEYLYVSWRAAGESGEACRPAYLVDSLKRLFPKLQTGKTELLLENVIERPEASVRELARGLQTFMERPLSDAYRELFAWYASRPDTRELTERLLEAAGASGRADALSRAAAEALYGRVMRNSATRLELFWQCEFAHFMSYGLRVKERPEYLFTGMDLGNILHRSLELFVARYPAEGWDEPEADPAVLLPLADQCVQDAAAEAGGHSVLHASARNEYQVKRMTRLMETAVKAVHAELSAGEFRPSGTEQAFRRNEDLEEMTIHLPGGALMVLTGRIDRVDTCEADGRTYVKIVDYKTGNVSFDPLEVYYGLQMQLVIYLSAALGLLRKAGHDPVPAGLFYSRIRDPLVEYVPDEPEEELRRRLLKEMRSSGVVSDDREILGRMDRSLLITGKSEVLPVSYGRGGTLTKTSKTMSEEGFRHLMRYTSHLAREAGIRILKGCAEAAPYQMGNRTACDYCAFRAACPFDRRLPGCRFRHLARLTSEEILERMEKANLRFEEEAEETISEPETGSIPEEAGAQNLTDQTEKREGR